MGWFLKFIWIIIFIILMNTNTKSIELNQFNLMIYCEYLLIEGKNFLMCNNQNITSVALNTFDAYKMIHHISLSQNRIQAFSADLLKNIKSTLKEIDFSFNLLTNSSSIQALAASALSINVDYNYLESSQNQRSDGPVICKLPSIENLQFEPVRELYYETERVRVTCKRGFKSTSSEVIYWTCQYHRPNCSDENCYKIVGFKVSCIPLEEMEINYFFGKEWKGPVYGIIAGLIYISLSVLFVVTCVVFKRANIAEMKEEERRKRASYIQLRSLRSSATESDSSDTDD